MEVGGLKLRVVCREMKLCAKAGIIEVSRARIPIS